MRRSFSNSHHFPAAALGCFRAGRAGRSAAVGAVLSVLLLVLGCMAARCDAACDAASVSGVCPHAAGSAEMRGDGGGCTRMGGSAERVTVGAAAATTCVSHALCTVPVAVRSDLRVGHDAGGAGMAVDAGRRVVVEWVRVAWGAGRDAPPGRLGRRVRLRTMRV